MKYFRAGTLLDLNQKKILFKTYYIHCNVLGAIANSSTRNRKQVVYVESVVRWGLLYSS